MRERGKVKMGWKKRRTAPDTLAEARKAATPHNVWNSLAHARSTHPFALRCSSWSGHRGSSDQEAPRSRQSRGPENRRVFEREDRAAHSSARGRLPWAHTTMVHRESQKDTHVEGKSGDNVQKAPTVGCWSFCVSFVLNALPNRETLCARQREEHTTAHTHTNIAALGVGGGLSGHAVVVADQIQTLLRASSAASAHTPCHPLHRARRSPPTTRLPARGLKATVPGSRPTLSTPPTPQLRRKRCCKPGASARPPVRSVGNWYSSPHNVVQLGSSYSGGWAPQSPGRLAPGCGARTGSKNRGRHRGLVFGDKDGALL